ncbi:MULTISPECIES: N-formylglutamate amidohydrolase [unclassified Aureimonas]|uniref:N-formylglutamate amidohydrolase n=1 Tax=unclassified Aureimonas TaxID=2615206 RepID=UPI0009E77FDF|nr:MULTISPECIES: N-formylglutamate amidohydrolase [unclassified Aureimonas]
MQTAIPTLETAAGPCPAFEIVEPGEQTLPFVFCSPHSGRAYPKDFLEQTRLGPDAIRRSEDLFVDQLFDFVPALGAPILQARFPRAYLDVNREPYELDPGMFAGPLPDFANSASVRVAGGLGTIPRIVAEREDIYNGKLPLTEIERRIEAIYFPFHEALEALIERTRRRFGFAILLDCHSMPSSVRLMPGGRRADMVVGDRFGTSALHAYVVMVTQRLSALGYEVTRNKPYAGGFITERYGRPRRGVHAIQIEINRALYADEVGFLPHDGFALLRRDLWSLVTCFAGEVEAGWQGDLAAAAE